MKSYFSHCIRFFFFILKRGRDKKLRKINNFNEKMGLKRAWNSEYMLRTWSLTMEKFRSIFSLIFISFTQSNEIWTGKLSTDLLHFLFCLMNFCALSIVFLKIFPNSLPQQCCHSKSGISHKLVLLNPF